jgi:hypothetical protein
LRVLAFPERLSVKRKLRGRKTKLRIVLLGEDFGRKSFAARMSSDFFENNDVYAKTSDWCDSKLAAFFGQRQTEQKVYGSPAKSVNARVPLAQKSCLARVIAPG